MSAMPAVEASSVETPPRPVRIGSVGYLNARPLVEGLDKCRGVELSFDAPSRLLGALLEERVDIALAPIVDALRSPEPIVAIPIGCIASDGPTRSVKLFSRTPMDRITRVLTDPDSKTSVALARVLLGRLFACSPLFERAEASVEGVAGSGVLPAGFDAVLLIGDKVELMDASREQPLRTLDLGQAWRELTGLPFVYAVWMCLASRQEEDLVGRGCDLLDRQRRRNGARLRWIASRRAAEHGRGVDQAIAYLEDNIVTELGDLERRGVERFTREAADVGVIPAGRRVVWRSSRSCVEASGAAL